MKNRNGTVKRVWLPGVLFFFDAKKRVPATMDKRGRGCGHGERERVAVKRKETKKERGKKKKKKREKEKKSDEASMGGKLFKTDPYSTSFDDDIRGSCRA